MVHLPVQVVPEGIASVNGSSTSMGCERIHTLDSVMYCGEFSEENGGRVSYLVDKISPAIDTDNNDWASQLVTVTTNEPSLPVSHLHHVLLTFDFYPAVSLTFVELDLFLCPEFNIGGESVTVFADNETSITLGSNSMEITQHTISLPTSCASLSTARILLQGGVATQPYYTWHLLVEFPTQTDIQWVHIGEVRFCDTPVPCESSHTDL